MPFFLEFFMAVIDITHLHEEDQLNTIINSTGNKYYCASAVQIAAVKQNPAFLCSIENPDHQTQLEAVRLNPNSIWWIKNPDEEMQIIAVTAKASSIGHFQPASQKVVTRYFEVIAGLPLSNSEYPSDNLKLKAIQTDYRALRYTQNATLEMQMIALSKRANAIVWIDAPTEEMLILAADSLEGVGCLDFDKHLFSEAVKTRAKQTLERAFNNDEPGCDVWKFRQLYLSLASEVEIIHLMNYSHFGYSVSIDDFPFEPCDTIKKRLIERDEIAEYVANIPLDWSMSEELQGWVAADWWDDGFGISFIENPCSKAKYEFLKLVSKVGKTTCPQPSAKLCFAALKKCRIDVIHKVLECIDYKNTRMQTVLLERLAGVPYSRRMVPTLKTMAAAIRHCENDELAHQTCKVVASMDGDLEREWEIITLIESSPIQQSELFLGTLNMRVADIGMPEVIAEQNDLEDILSMELF